ncbi:MAG TPA: hypothetical protein VMU96_10075 [Casimicrobiaceae bacterium]|nr:hypothetical protein [Casimicrobiaceae bacterium]
MSTPHGKKPLTDDDPTVEEEAPGFDPTRTDEIELGIVSARHTSTGVIEHDDRGQARWVLTPKHEPADDADATFDELRALTNERLQLDDSVPSEKEKNPKGGYNPYNTDVPQHPQKKKRTSPQR